MFTTDRAAEELKKYPGKTMVVRIDGRVFEIDGIVAIDDDEIEFSVVEDEPEE